MAFYTSDVKFYLSGGLANRSASASLGGLPSGEEVGDSLNNLFGKVSKDEINNGSTAFRCIYIVNHGSETMYSVSLWIEPNDDYLSSSYVGIGFATEIQKIVLSGIPTSGTFTLRYTDAVNGVQVSQETNPITFSSDATTMASNIQTALNALELLGEVSVSVNQDSDWNYHITFGGMHDNRYHQLLEVTNNEIIGTDINFTVSITTSGSPINATATNVGESNQPPVGISFSQPFSQDGSIEVGTLEPLDTFSVWFKRVVTAGVVVTSTSVDTDMIKIFAQVDI